MPKVSVIIPAYNAMSYLPETIDSVLKQTFTDLEILVVDDGSSDNIANWASKVTDVRLKLISQTNQGTPKARNNGIARATGEYIAFLDADDLWEPTKIEKQVYCLETNLAVGLVYTWAFLINEQGKHTGRILTSHIEGDCWKKMIEKDEIVTSSVIVRRSCLENLGVFDENLLFSEDWDMWIRIAASYPFAVVKEPLIGYRLHQHNKTKKCEEMLQDCRTIIERAFEKAPLKLLYIRSRSYGHVFIYYAWKYLENANYIEAISCSKQAIVHYPQLQYSWNYIRLSLAITLMQRFDAPFYRQLLSFMYTLRRLVSGVA